MINKFHTVVIGGGCLGVASAIALSRKLKNKGNSVCILEKSVLAGGISSRHSGIIRSANASIQAATFAEQANLMWLKFHNHWGVDIKPEFPRKPHITIKNDFSKSLAELSKELKTKIKKFTYEKN